MKESIASRVARLVSASLHGMIDKVEGLAPDAVMEQALREIDGAVDEVRAELGRVIANKHLAAKRLAEEQQKHAELAERMALAVKQGRDDLAEAAIARQMDIEAQLPVLEQALADFGSQEKELESYVAALRARRRDMEDERRDFVAARRSAAGDGILPGDGGEQPSAVGDKVSKASAAFDRVTNAEGVPGTGKAALKTAAQLAELEELARKNRIQERLAALKAGSR
jgi:phage shock protein A